jgi:hypothetical protein
MAVSIVALQLSSAVQLGCSQVPAGGASPLVTGAQYKHQQRRTLDGGGAAGAIGSNGNVLVSGQTTVFVIDGDGDGPDSGDCRFTAVLSGGALIVSTVQDSTTPLSACSGFFYGNLFSGTDTSSDYFGAALSSTTIGSSLFEPMRIEMVDEQAHPDGLPVHHDDRQDTIEVASLATGQIFAVAQLCANPAPKLVAQMGGGTFDFPLTFATDAGDQGYVRLPIPLLNWELAAILGTTTALNVFVPVTSAHQLTVALDSDPTNLFVDVNLDTLPSCGGNRVAAPASTPVSLAALAVLLLGAGTWLALRHKARR